MGLSKQGHVGIRRNPETRQAELCIPAAIRWGAGIVSVIITAGIPAIIFSIGQTEAKVEMVLDRQERYEKRIEAEIEETEDRLLREIDRRHQ